MKTPNNTRISGSIALPKDLVVRKGEIVQSDEFVAFVMAQKHMQDQIDNNWAMVQEFMEKKQIPTVKGSWGHITLADRKTLNAMIPLPPRFYKQVLDTSKLTAYKTMKGEYPEGVKETHSKYLSKRVLV